MKATPRSRRVAAQGSINGSRKLSYVRLRSNLPCPSHSRLLPFVANEVRSSCGRMGWNRHVGERFGDLVICDVEKT